MLRELCVYTRYFVYIVSVTFLLNEFIEPYSMNNIYLKIEIIEEKKKTTQHMSNTTRHLWYVVGKKKKKKYMKISFNRKCV